MFAGNSQCGPQEAEVDHQIITVDNKGSWFGPFLLVCSYISLLVLLLPLNLGCEPTDASVIIVSAKLLIMIVGVLLYRIIGIANCLGVVWFMFQLPFFFVGMGRQTSQLNVGDLISHANNGIYFCVIIALALLYYFLNNLSLMPKVV